MASFPHLFRQSEDTKHLLERNEIHPAIKTLALKTLNGQSHTPNSRCVAMLPALKQVVRDYVVPKERNILIDLDRLVNGACAVLRKCLPFSTGMENARVYLSVSSIFINYFNNVCCK